MVYIKMFLCSFFSSSCTFHNTINTVSYSCNAASCVTSVFKLFLTKLPFFFFFHLLCTQLFKNKSFTVTVFVDLNLRYVFLCFLLQLLSTVDESTSDVSGLHDKLDRKKKVTTFNLCISKCGDFSTFQN